MSDSTTAVVVWLNEVALSLSSQGDFRSAMLVQRLRDEASAKFAPVNRAALVELHGKIKAGLMPADDRARIGGLRSAYLDADDYLVLIVARLAAALGLERED